MADPCNFEKLEAALRQRFVLPAVKVVVDREQYTEIGGDLFAKLIGTQPPFEVSIDDPLDKNAFPRRMTILTCDVYPFFDSHETALQTLAQHFDALLANRPVRVALPPADELLNQLKTEPPMVKLSDLAKTTIAVKVSISTWKSEADGVPFLSLFSQQALFEAWEEARRIEEKIKFREFF